MSLLDHGIRALLFDVHYGVPLGDRVRTDIDDEAASRAKFEKAIGKEAVDAAMRIRARLQGAPTGPRAAYLCHGFCELGATPLVAMLRGRARLPGLPPGRGAGVRDRGLRRRRPTSPRRSARAGSSGSSTAAPRSRPGPRCASWSTPTSGFSCSARTTPTGVPWYHPAFEVVQETPYKFIAPEEFSCRPNRGGTRGPLFQINHWIETTAGPEAVERGDRERARLPAGPGARVPAGAPQLPNILAVDFAGTGDVVGVAAEMNGLAPAPERPAP